MASPFKFYMRNLCRYMTGEIKYKLLVKVKVTVKVVSMSRLYQVQTAKFSFSVYFDCYCATQMNFSDGKSFWFGPGLLNTKIIDVLIVIILLKYICPLLVISRCSPVEPCKHNGVCDKSRCFCTNTDHYGPLCETGKKLL